MKKPMIVPWGTALVVSSGMIGDADIVQPEHAVQMFRLFPRAQLAVLPGTDHFAAMRRPDWIVPMV
jgi:pimeloyl-ACP methyl ester carboxylesterase